MAILTMIESYITGFFALPFMAPVVTFIAPVLNWVEGMCAKFGLGAFWHSIFVVALLLAIIIFFSILGAIFGKKKRKVIFMVDGKKYATKIVKYKHKLKFPRKKPAKKGYTFEGWYKDEGFTTPLTDKKLLSKKGLVLYAKFVANEAVAEAPVPTIEEPVQESAPQVPTQESTPAPQIIVEESIHVEADKTLGEIYDDLRVQMLSYNRVKAFGEFGLHRKHVVAEMFEKDGVVYLYLAVSPELMQEKGYKVEKFTKPEFAIVPCMKAIKGASDYPEAVSLIKEAMLLNNLIKNEDVVIPVVKSDEKARKMGFAFFVKNEQVASSADDYYRLVRQNVLCYSPSTTVAIPASLDNKMILKIFKKKEEIFVYLAFNAEAEGLTFVGYDKNFVETPSMFKITSFEDVVKAYYLIDKLMYRFGMVKHPENAESVDKSQLQENCGFGYRIKL